MTTVSEAKSPEQDVESGRGALGCYIVSDGTPKPYMLAEIGGIEWFWQDAGTQIHLSLLTS